MRSWFLPSISASLLALTALSVPASAQSRDGWTYTTNTFTIDSTRISTRVRYRIAGTAYRMDDLPTSGSAARTPEGAYQIFNRADTTMTTVMPSQHMAMVMGLNSLRAILAPRMVRHLTKNEFEDLGAGEKILGHATRHVRVTTVGTIELTMTGQTCKQPLDEVTEAWIAPDVDLQALDAGPFTPPGDPWVTLALGNIVVDSIAGQLGLANKTMPKGAALRTIWRSVEPDSTGRSITLRSTSEVVDLTFGPLDASIFAVPADFQTMDLRSAERMDSTTKANMTAELATALRSFCPSPTGRGGYGLLSGYDEMQTIPFETGGFLPWSVNVAVPDDRSARRVVIERVGAGQQSRPLGKLKVNDLLPPELRKSKHETPMLVSTTSMCESEACHRVGCDLRKPILSGCDGASGAAARWPAESGTRDDDVATLS